MKGRKVGQSRVSAEASITMKRNTMKLSLWAEISQNTLATGQNQYFGLALKHTGSPIQQRNKPKLYFIRWIKFLKMDLVRKYLLADDCATSKDCSTSSRQEYRESHSDA